MKNKLTVIPFLMALGTYLYVCFGLSYQYPDYFAPVGVSAEVTIPSGMSAGEAARMLRDAGLVTDAAEMIKAMTSLGIDRTLKPGVYELNSGSAMNVAKQLQEAKPRNEIVTLIPGMRYWRVAQAIYGSDDKRDLLTQELSKKENFPEQIRDKLPEKPEDRFVFLLPETYMVVPGGDVGKQAVVRASRLWWERIGKTLSEDITPKELLQLGVLASVVEGEARVAEERPVLAGIFLSRIKQRMRLQSCATVIYSWELQGVKKSGLTYKDLEIASPYNTYTHDGLPPGPISIPSQASWEAAVNPQETEYLFFFATSNGSHIFSKTYQEHLRQQRGEQNK